MWKSTVVISLFLMVSLAAQADTPFYQRTATSPEIIEIHKDLAGDRCFKTISKEYGVVANRFEMDLESSECDDIRESRKNIAKVLATNEQLKRKGVAAKCSPQEAVFSVAHTSVFARSKALHLIDNCACIERELYTTAVRVDEKWHIADYKRCLRFFPPEQASAIKEALNAL